MVSDAISAAHLGHPWSRRVRASGSWCTRQDPYQGAGFYVVLQGRCRLMADGSAPLTLGAGDAVLLPHGAGHLIAGDSAGAVGAERAPVPFEQWCADTGSGARRGGDGTEVLCGRYRLDCSRMHPLMTELPEVVHLPRRAGGNLELRAVVDLLAGELDEARPGSGVALPSLLDLLFVYIVRAWMTDARDASWPRVLADPVVAAALRALHADPGAPWSNELLAAEAGVSRPTLARRFTTLTGSPPMAYLTWWRVIRAATLLRETRDTLATIAGRVGYGSPYALSHAFKREFGTTPGRYRLLAAGRSAGITAP